MQVAHWKSFQPIQVQLPILRAFAKQPVTNLLESGEDGGAYRFLIKKS